jgi:hypothetical protein
VSGKIITKVRERQERAQQVQQQGAIKIVRDPLNVYFDRHRDPPICRMYEISGETPSAYASDPISRFFRWVFRL